MLRRTLIFSLAAAALSGCVKASTVTSEFATRSHNALKLATNRGGQHEKCIEACLENISAAKRDKIGSLLTSSRANQLRTAVDAACDPAGVPR